jgi:predicted DNA-binding transcriptional regulator AlpA
LAVSRNEAPAPIKIGRASVWDSRAIDAWIDAQRDRSGRTA